MSASASVRSPRRVVVIHVVVDLPELVVVVVVVRIIVGDQIGRELVRRESQHVRHDPHVTLATAAVAIRAEAGVGARRESPEEHGDVGEREPEPGGGGFLPPHLRDVLPPTLCGSAVARVPHPRASEHRQEVVAQRLAVSQRRAFPLALRGAQRDVRPSRRRVAREVNRVEVRHRRVPGDGRRRRDGRRDCPSSNAGRRRAWRRFHALNEAVHAHELPRPRPVPLPAHAAHEPPVAFVLLVVGDVLDAEHAARGRRRRE
mmetsp:Transcript_4011/g.17782  ORF Transcript_4011/g.17782 Transcript_4011/m.17782 type:complete len:259 (+) Transcript_4011:4192-4968(+)